MYIYIKLTVFQVEGLGRVGDLVPRRVVVLDHGGLLSHDRVVVGARREGLDIDAAARDQRLGLRREPGRAVKALEKE